MKTIIKFSLIFLVISIIGLLLYSFIGTDTNVAEIRKIAPAEITKRNWTILRYEGYEYGSWGNNGGKVWYHVMNTDNHNIQYRIYITLWKGELQYCYGAPEILSRVDVNLK